MQPNSALTYHSQIKCNSSLRYFLFISKIHEWQEICEVRCKGKSRNQAVDVTQRKILIQK